jgi:hypothetical protein
MMEKFDEFLDSIKKVEIEDEEFKKELKNKLYSIYDKRKALKKRSFIFKSLSYAVVILLILLPIFFILNKTFIKKQTGENSYLVRTLKSPYEEKILKIVENDEILEEKMENNELIKIYKSGIKIYEKDGNFVKIISGEENLREYNIDLNDIKKFVGEEEIKNLTLDSNYLNKILEIFKNDKKFDFVEKDKIKNIFNYNENLILTLINSENGDWLFLIDLKVNKIIYFEYPFQK